MCGKIFVRAPFLPAGRPVSPVEQSRVFDHYHQLFDSENPANVQIATPIFLEHWLQFPQKKALAWAQWSGRKRSVDHSNRFATPASSKLWDGGLSGLTRSAVAQQIYTWPARKPGRFFDRLYRLHCTAFSRVLQRVSFLTIQGGSSYCFAPPSLGSPRASLGGSAAEPSQHKRERKPACPSSAGFYRRGLCGPRSTVTRSLVPTRVHTVRAVGYRCWR